MSIDNVVDKIYKLSDKIEKSKQRHASLKGRKEEVLKRSKKRWGISDIEGLSKIQSKIKSGIKEEESKISEMYEELKKDFEDDDND